MKLYFHPISTTCRPIMLFAADNGIQIDYQVVDLFTGEHVQPPYTAKNPSGLVPMLEDGDFRLTECSAILKYLAESIDSPTYPRDLKKRARVNERMDWLNTQFYRDFGYGLVYPQLFPHHKRRSDEAHGGCIEWGKQGAQRWLQVLNDHWIGSHPYLCGDSITIADYLGSGIVSIGALIGEDFAAFPNVQRWLGNMKKLEHWSTANAALEGAAAGNAGKEFVRV